MFERFTETGRQVVVLAQDEARRLEHHYIGTEHLLLGLLREQEGLAARVLGSLEVTLDTARTLVEQRVGRGETAKAGQIPFSPRAKKVLELALREALSIGHTYIGTEHILLGLTREGEGAAAAVLLELGLDSERIRSEVIEALGPHAIGAPIGAARRVRRQRMFGGMSKRPVWEYRVEHCDHLDAGWLNQVGADAWELVSVQKETAGLELIFKRRREFAALRAAG